MYNMWEYGCLYWQKFNSWYHLYGPLARYVKLRVAHAAGTPGTLSPPSRVSDPDMHHGTCITHVPWCISESLTSGFLWSLWWRKRSRHSQHMRNPQFNVSDKRPMVAGHIISELHHTSCRITRRRILCRQEVLNIWQVKIKYEGQ